MAGRGDFPRLAVGLPFRRTPNQEKEAKMFKNYRNIAIPAVVVALLGVSSPDANAVNYSKMETRLAGILDADYRAPGQSVDTIKAGMEFLKQIDGWPGAEPDRFYVYIQVDPAFQVAALPPYVQVVDQDEAWKLVAAWVPESDLAALSDELAVDSIRCVHPPKHRMQGIRDTQGNQLHNADNARLNKGINGAPIKVGVVSDGVSNWPPVAGTNDLPPGIELPMGMGTGDEGTAMLEIIHDLAPGSLLAFCPSGGNIVSFKNAVAALVQTSNCKVVCDDVGWYSEPYFYHGNVAQHLQALGAGTNYVHVSAAGNDAEVHHQQLFTDANSNNEHDPLLQATLPNGGVLEVWLQWNDNVPNYGDYDIVLEDNSTGTSLPTASYSRSAAGGGYPGEYAIYINNTGSTQTVDAVIKYVSGNKNRTMEVFFELWNGAFITTASKPNFSAADSIIGQAALPGVVAVGAVNQATPTAIESFSSQGPVTHINTPQIQKPDVVGVDNVTVSVGVTAPWSGFPTSFSGTSAAAPHIVGLLALAWSYSPSVSPAGLVSAMTSTAADLGTGGFDSIFGFGLPDADLTAGALNLPPVLTVPIATINATQKVGKPVVGLSVSDPDVGSGNLTLTFTASNGTITVDGTVANGVILNEITGNGTNYVTVTAAASAINTTLASQNGVKYLGNGGFIGSQSMNLVLSDNGNTGLGGALVAGGSVQLMLHNNAYETWARDRFGQDVDNPSIESTVWGLVANPDNDTYPNQWEFFIGADPKSADTPGVIVQTISGSNFIYTLRVNNEIDSNAYDVRYSTDLGTWTSVPSGQWTKTPHPTVPDTTEVKITRPLTTREFLRISFDPHYQVP
jgi:Subtilase family